MSVEVEYFALLELGVLGAGHDFLYLQFDFAQFERLALLQRVASPEGPGNYVGPFTANSLFVPVTLPDLDLARLDHLHEVLPSFVFALREQFEAAHQFVQSGVLGPEVEFGLTRLAPFDVELGLGWSEAAEVHEVVVLRVGALGERECILERLEVFELVVGLGIEIEEFSELPYPGVDEEFDAV